MDTTKFSVVRGRTIAMPLFVALAVAIGVIAVPVIWVFLGPLAALNFQIWQCFLAWGCSYACGGKSAGVVKTLTCMAFGAVVGAVVVALAGYLGMLGSFAVPVAGAVGAAAIVLASFFPPLATIPASVYGFAAIAALILLKGLTPLEALMPTVGGIVIGALVGWVSEAAGVTLAKTV
jgi:hypothetical protein